ncbi:MAG TPA: IclR family transcriptional regulator [Solirubrobacter sp.]|nr:IclR family transcriptional regulator [Solirubrobacter sp.]
MDTDDMISQDREQTPADDGRSRGTVQSVVRSLRLLEEIAASAEIGLIELTRRTGLSPSTTHRLLATLIECGYVVQGPSSNRYRLGHRVAALSGSIDDRLARLRAAAQPAMIKLRDAHDETVNLSVLDGLNLVYVDQLGSSRAVRMFTRIGSHVPAYATGSGKAMLAFSSDALQEELYAAEPYEQFAPNTITAAERLREELTRIRSRGYALDREEYDEGVVCVAAPIFNHAGGLGALSVSGPASRMYRMDLSLIGEQVAAYGLEISRELGYVA